jgi:hypothetical protein
MEQYTVNIYFNAIMKICCNMCSEPYFAKSALIAIQTFAIIL